LQGVHEENVASEAERKNAVRYHKVKFFERIKLERRLRKNIKEHLEREREGDAAAAALRAAAAERK